jgi:hypothetical protein
VIFRPHVPHLIHSTPSLPIRSPKMIAPSLARSRRGSRCCSSVVLFARQAEKCTYRRFSFALSGLAVRSLKDVEP